MSSWLHCNNPEPHTYHEWSTSVEVDPPHLYVPIYYSSSHMCPGVKGSPELAELVRLRDEAAEHLAARESALNVTSVRYRRTPYQFYMNDDNAPAEDPG